MRSQGAQECVCVCVGGVLPGGMSGLCTAGDILAKQVLPYTSVWLPPSLPHPLPFLGRMCLSFGLGHFGDNLHIQHQ